MTNTKQIYPQTHKRWLRDDEYLWRYVPLRYLLLYLDGNIFIPSVEKLRQTDPFEGNFPLASSSFNSAIQHRYGSNESKVDDWLYQRRCNKEERELMDQNKGQESFANHKAHILMTRYFEFIRKTRYAWCWFLGPESAAMWSVYGKQGVAIGTTVGRISHTFAKGDLDGAFGQMLYVEVTQGQVLDLDPGEPEDQEFMLQPHFMKRKEYASEKEVRFVAYGPENPKTGGMVLKTIEPNDWIQEIVFCPTFTCSESESLSKAVKRVAPNIRCRKSDLLTSHDDNGYDENGPEAAMAETDRKSWADNTDGIPSFLKRHEC